MVVLEERAGAAAGVLALAMAFIDHASLAASGAAAAWAGIDREALGVVEQQRDEGLGEQGGDGVV